MISLSREDWQKICEVEGLTYPLWMKELFSDFDKNELTDEQRREEIKSLYSLIS